MLKIPINLVYKFYKMKDFFYNKNNEQPPKSMLYFTGQGNAIDIGKTFLKYFVEYADLKPTDTMLDVGCGVGRMAIPLTSFLKTGTYYGFDIFEDGIKWCQNNISTECSNFYFKFVDVCNRNYNPNGEIDVSKFKFPYADNTFDFVCANSVFTHLIPEDMNHYLSEIHRVLKKNGTFFSTFFIMNEESENLIKNKKSSFAFKYGDHQDYATLKNKLTEHAIAYNDEYLKKCLSEHNFHILTIYYGNWCNRANFLSSHDIIIAKSY